MSNCLPCFLSSNGAISNPRNLKRTSHETFADFYVFLLSTTSYAKIEYKISKVHGQIKFLDLLLEGKKEYWELINKQEKKKVKNIIKSYSDLKLTSLNKQIPTHGSFHQSIHSLFLWHAMNASNHKQFNNRITGLLPLDQKTQFLDLITKVSVYFDPFWEKNKHHLTHFQKRSNQEFKTNSKVRALNDSIKAFYHSQWPSNLNFNVGLYLLPKKTRFSSAQSLDQFEESSIIIGEDFESRLGIIIHEMCHSHFTNMKRKKFIEMKNYFFSKDSLVAKTAYHYLNEAMATAIGNGYTYNILTGKHDQKWYNDPYIDGFAKKLYPLIKTYLKKNKSLDKTFYERSIQIFSKKFPNLDKKFEILLNSPLISTVGYIDQQEVKNAIQRHFHFSRTSYSSPFTHPYTLEDYKKDQSPLILLIKDWKYERMKKIQKSYPKIFDKIEKATNKDWFYFFQNKKFHLIIKYIDFKSLNETLKKIKEQAYIR